MTQYTRGNTGTSNEHYDLVSIMCSRQHRRTTGISEMLSKVATAS